MPSAAPRIVIAEDLALLRDGLIRLFTAHGFEVAEAVDNGPSLLRALTTLRPDVAVVDVRLPPTLTDEGLRAAIEARRQVPGLVRAVARLLGAPLQRFGSVSGYLAVQSLRGRTAQAAGALMPVILFAGIGMGTLYMQSIENAATAATGLAKTDDQKMIEALNLVVVGMIVLFAAILVVNTLIAATTHRRREFGQQRLVGATPAQVLRAVALENLVLAITGLALGALAALATVLPYSYARTDTLLPHDRLGIDLGIAAVAVAITLAAGLGTARRGVRVAAVEAVAG